MIDEWLETLALKDRSEWDVLLFLHHHRLALVSAENIACFLGYQPDAVVRALDELESAGLLVRSRLDEGARWHQLAQLDGPRGLALEELMKLSETRAGRLAVVQTLRRRRIHKAEGGVTVLKSRANPPPDKRATRFDPRLDPRRRKSG